MRVRVTLKLLADGLDLLRCSTSSPISEPYCMQDLMRAPQASKQFADAPEQPTPLGCLGSDEQHPTSVPKRPRPPCGYYSTDNDQAPGQPFMYGTGEAGWREGMFAQGGSGHSLY